MTGGKSRQPTTATKVIVDLESTNGNRRRRTPSFEEDGRSGVSESISWRQSAEIRFPSLGRRREKVLTASSRPDLKSEQFVAGTWGELFLF
jgi:hypothetical protein